MTFPIHRRSRMEAYRLTSEELKLGVRTLGCEDKVATKNCLRVMTVHDRGVMNGLVLRGLAGRKVDGTYYLRAEGIEAVFVQTSFQLGDIG